MTIIPMYDVQIMGRSLAQVFSIGGKSSRQTTPDTAQVVLPWGDELASGMVERGVPVTLALGNAELGVAVILDGQVSKIEKKGVHATIHIEDYLTWADDTSWTQSWEKGTPADAVVSDMLMGCGLDGSVHNPIGHELAADLHLEEQPVIEGLRSMAGRYGYDCWIIPGTRTVYWGPRWPYSKGHLTQEQVWALNVNSLQMASKPDLEWREAGKYNAVKVICYDPAFTGESPTVATAGEGQPVKVIRIAQKLDIDKATDRATEELTKLKANGLEGTIITYTNPYIQHSQMIRLEGHARVPESDYPIESLTYNFDPKKGSKMTINLASIVEMG